MIYLYIYYKMMSFFLEKTGFKNNKNQKPPNMIDFILFE